MVQPTSHKKHTDGHIPKEEFREFYKIALDTRNLEITLFWQRSNYFLVLNSGLALGFFNLQQTNYAPVMMIFGLLSSLLWVQVCLGGKFWQTRWEQRLSDYEEMHYPTLNFFASSPERLQDDVVKGLAFYQSRFLKQYIYKHIPRKASVSLAMILLACLFVLGWTTLIVVYFLSIPIKSPTS